ncbi:MAG TPA: hypothetical protein VFY96_01945, partial [Candidatus Binatia bacterium]|nr:hypothetical protein [Candidatus Binatia bacterium]
MGAAVAKADTKAEHAGCSTSQVASLFLLAGSPEALAHNRKAVWVKAGSFERVIVATSFPRRRYKNRSINFGSCHFLQQLLAC